MIPVLGIPCISRPDLLADCIASIDYPVARLVVIDNSPEGLDVAAPPACVERMDVIRPGDNLGFSGSLNHVIKTNAQAPWWMFANADAVFAPGDMARVVEQMESHADEPFLCGIRDFRLFGQNARLVETVGFWDENFAPMYCEDSDLVRRITVSGTAHYLMLPGDTGHVGSATIQEARYGLRNIRTYNSNRAYYRAKWGGDINAETFTTPFDRGGSVADWTLDLSRLRDNTWT